MRLGIDYLARHRPRGARVFRQLYVYWRGIGRAEPRVLFRQLYVYWRGTGRAEPRVLFRQLYVYWRGIGRAEPRVLFRQQKAWFLLAAWGVGALAAGHGNVTPQPVDTKGLPALQGPLTQNPYRGSPNQQLATQVGSSAFNQNCARCHGLEAISGGIAPDLRHLPKGTEGDEYFQMRIRNGSVRNGVTYMPPFGEIFSEEAIWAIRTYLDSRYEE